jgi:hypothetical protein
MQRFALFIFLVGCVASLALHTAKGAQDQSAPPLTQSCADSSACEPEQPAANTAVICLKGQERESCPIAIFVTNGRTYP